MKIEMKTLLKNHYLNDFLTIHGRIKLLFDFNGPDALFCLHNGHVYYLWLSKCKKYNKLKKRVQICATIIPNNVSHTF